MSTRRKGALLAVVGGGIYIGCDSERRARTKARVEAATRVSRLLSCATVIAIDYKWAGWQARLDPDMLAIGPARERQRELDTVAGKLERQLRSEASDHHQLQQATATARQEAAEAAEAVAEVQHRLSLRVWDVVHERNAARMLQLCRANGGVYIKIGQHLAQMDYLLPRAYTSTLAAMLADAPSSSYQDVVSTITEQLGQPPEQLFHNFEPEPIACASLAQVHRATHKQTGAPLAVKVQHRGLASTSQGDLDAVSLVTHWAAWATEADFRWLADEIAPNLPKATRHCP